MASGESIDLSGFDELDAAMSELGKGLEKALLIRVAKKALQPVKEEARRLAPHDEGWLEESVVTGTGPLTRGAAKDELIDKGAVRVFLGTANRNAVPREFGAIRGGVLIPAEPFFRPAWEANTDRMMKTIIDELGPEIERTAVRAARRKAKRG